MNYFQKYLAEEFAEDYQEGRLSRQAALELISSITGNRGSAGDILNASQPRAAGEASMRAFTAQARAGVGGFLDQANPAGSSAGTASGSAAPPPEVAPDDPRIEAGEMRFQAGPAALQGYLARPRWDGPHALVLVCHENRGLTPYVQDVTRRLAVAGYAALAIDLLSRSGGSASLSPTDIPGILGNIPPDQFVSDFLSGYAFMQQQDYVHKSRAGMVGFCFGGGVTWQVAIHLPELKAAVPYYGPLPPVDQVASIQAAVLAIYGGKDQRINQGIPPVENAMREQHKIFEKIIYPNADHAFHNFTGTRYDPEAARDAWSHTLDWLRKYLAG